MIPAITNSLATSQSALLIAGSGLITDLLSSSLQPYCNSDSLVFVLKASHEAQRILCYLSDHGVSKDLLPKILTSTTMSTVERERMYLRGGVYICTSRILILDLLQQRVVPSAITGIFVNDAHRISEASTEAFIIRMYRESNNKPDSFVKAISDEVCALVGGFNRVGKIMETLSVGTIYLWPRFHLSIKEYCAKHQPDVVQLAVSLTPRMKRIQASIIEIMVACTAQLAHTTNIDLNEMTAETNILFSADARLRGKINKAKHLRGSKLRASNELISDLKTLRHMLSSLLIHDCISFYKMLESIRVTASVKSDGLFQKEPSQWLLLEATETLFQTAKERVHLPLPIPSLKKSKPMQSKRRNRRTIVLEHSPKWHVLLEILGEIRNHVASHASRTASSREKKGRHRQVDDDSIDNPVIIFCKSARTVTQLTGVLTSSPKGYLRRKYEDDFLNKSKSKSNPISNPKSKSKTSASSYKGGSKKETSKHRVPSATASFKQLTSTLGLPDACAGLTHWWGAERSAAMSMSIPQPGISISTSSSLSTPTIPTAKRLDSQNILIELHDKRHSKVAYDLLKEVEPSFVIMYDANPTLTRQLELYAASRPDKALRVYFLVYEGSVEERRYLENIEEERKAFQRLIEHKSLMTGIDRRSATRFTNQSSTSMQAQANSSNNSRHGGGGVDREKEKQGEGGAVTSSSSSSSTSASASTSTSASTTHRRCVIVDTREFRSVLPLMLHREGIEIVPMTLTVGDYILTPKMSIERKSIPDLFGSLRSGRLYKQAEQMCTHFEQPMLLIEFDNNRPFRLEDTHTREISQHSIVSKLVLVLLHFPALHFLWMVNPRATASLFDKLKENQDEPEDHIGVASNLSSNSFDSTEGLASYKTNRSTLRMVPGVTAGNFHKVIKQVKSLAEFSRLSLTTCQDIMGKMAGKKAYDFFNANGVSKLKR